MYEHALSHAELQLIQSRSMSKLRKWIVRQMSIGKY